MDDLIRLPCPRTSIVSMAGLPPAMMLQFLNSTRNDVSSLSYSQHKVARTSSGIRRATWYEQKSCEVSEGVDAVITGTDMTD
jgi:hypothetical protein